MMTEQACWPVVIAMSAVAKHASEPAWSQVIPDSSLLLVVDSLPELVESEVESAVVVLLVVVEVSPEVVVVPLVVPESSPVVLVVLASVESCPVLDVASLESSVALASSEL